MNKPKLLFIFEMPIENVKWWADGLWAALNILEKDFEIERWNIGLKNEVPYNTPPDQYDFVLGWGSFSSKPDQHIQQHMQAYFKTGLCVAGNAKPCIGKENYNILFCETEIIKKAYIKDHPKVIVAFGVNTEIFHPIKSPKIWDFTTVGAFSLWKRQERILEKEGNKLAVGYIQKDNLRESLDIIGNLLAGGVMVSDQVSPETLAKIYNASENILLPADIYGGSERAVLESRACGVNVEISNDNPKLKELLEKPIVDAKGYALALLEGITSCLKQ